MAWYDMDMDMIYVDSRVGTNWNNKPMIFATGNYLRDKKQNRNPVIIDWNLKNKNQQNKRILALWCCVLLIFHLVLLRSHFFNACCNNCLKYMKVNTVKIENIITKMKDTSFFSLNFHIILYPQILSLDKVYE